MYEPGEVKDVAEARGGRRGAGTSCAGGSRPGGASRRTSRGR